MAKVEIFLDGTIYEGYERGNDSEKIKLRISRKIDAKKYYLLKVKGGQNIMFPRHALLRGKIKITTEERQ